MDIPVRCRTYIDEAKDKKWPEKLCCRPVVGDRVVAQDGCVLYIATITHSQTPIDWGTRTELCDPHLEIELHKREAI